MFFNSSAHTERTKRGNSEKCISNSDQIKNHAQRFSQGHWTSLGPGDEEKWYGTFSYKPVGKLDSVAPSIVQRFAETGHSIFKGICALIRGVLKRKHKQRHQTLQCWLVEHRRNHVSNQPLSKPAQSTEQCPTAVKNLVKTNDTNTSEKLETTERTLKEVRPLEVNSLVQTPRMTSRLRETDCETLIKDLKNWIRKPYSYESVAQQHSGNWSLWVCDTKLSLTLMMVLEGRSNTNMQIIHTSSITSKCQSLRSDSREYDNWTSSSSSHGEISWQLWNRNSDFFHG